MSTPPSQAPGIAGRVRARLTGALGGDGTKARVLRGSSWTIIGFVIEQMIRLATSLILTRLLFPEAFGLMALAQVFLIGLEMFSDVGLRPAIIQSDRGLDPRFLNTAWTLQIVRGFVLWGLCCVLAIPAGRIYGESALTPILCVLGASAAISGFQTMAHATLNKQLRLERLTAIQITGQVIGVGAMITWAWVEPTVWALVGGGLVGSLAKLILGFAFLPGHGHAVEWDRESARELFGFGSWIFVSSILGFVANHGDRLILGRFLTMESLGMYQLAQNLGNLSKRLHDRLGGTVLLPLFAEKRSIDAKSTRLARPHLIRVRLSLAGLLVPATAVFLLFGQEIIDLLYDDRYAEAGWKLQVLAAGVGFHVATNIGQYPLAFGDSRLYTGLSAARAACLIGSMTAGGMLYGEVGIIVGVATVPLLFYPVEALTQRRYGLWLWKIDLLLIAVVAGVAAIAAMRSGLI